MPSELSQRAAMTAEYHLQLAISEVQWPEVGRSEATVRGEVVRMFRGSKELLGWELRLEVSVAGDRREALAAAKVLEAYVDPTAEGYVIAADNLALLAQTTQLPQIPAPPLQAAALARTRSAWWLLAAAAGVAVVVLIVSQWR